jgi:enediyne biosynthesis protein E4
LGGGFDTPKVGRGLAVGDFDRNGQLDLLMTTNHGPAFLYRNEQTGGNRSIRIRLVGTSSNRDGIGALVRLYNHGEMQTRLVHSGSSYLSQSELPVTFGVGKADKAERATIHWPNGRTEEYKNLLAGKAYQIVESSGITEDPRR